MKSRYIKLTNIFDIDRFQIFSKVFILQVEALTGLFVVAANLTFSFQVKSSFFEHI